MITPTWPAVRSALLDAVAVNLAVLADCGHGVGTHLRLGAPLRLGRAVTADGLPTAEPTLDDHLVDAGELLGLEVVRRWRDVPSAELAASLRPDRPTYVVADSYHLPWTPDAGRRHRAHSFLVVGEGCGCRSTVVDAHHEDTPWGRARPLRIPYVADTVTAPRVDEVLWIEPTELGWAPAPRAEGLDPASVAAFLAPYRGALAGPDTVTAVDRIAREARLLQRSRWLHAAYRGFDRHPGPVAEHFSEWARTTAQLSAAARRVREAPADVGPAAAALDRLGRVLGADAAAFAADIGPRPKELATR